MKKKDQYVLVFGSKIPRWRDCPECKSKLTCEMGRYGYATRCKKCQWKKDKADRAKNPKVKYSFVIGKGYKEVTAIGIDKATGRQVGVTEKGEHVPIENTRYNTKTDPHGWKVAGKKIRPFDSKGNPNT